MTTFLRPSASSVRFSRSFLNTCTLSGRSYVQAPHFYRSQLLARQLRKYATNNSKEPEESRDSAEKTAKEDTDTTVDGRVDKKETVSVGGKPLEPGKAAPGFEHFYKGKTLSTPPQGEQNKTLPEDDATKSEPPKMTAEDEARLDAALKRVLPSLPSSIAKDVEKAFENMKKHGVPKEFLELIEKIQKGAPLTLSNAARLIRITTTMARKAADKQAKEEAKQRRANKSSASRDQNEDQKSRSQEQFKIPEVKFDASTFLTFALTAYLFYRMIMPTENSREITWQEFRTSFLDKGLVEKLVVINRNKVKVFLHKEAVSSIHPDSPAVHNNFFYYFTIGSVEAFENKVDDAQADLGIPSSERIPVSYTDEMSWTSAILSFGPTLFFIGLLLWSSRRLGGGAGGGSSSIFGMGRSRAKRFNHESDVQIRFRDVAGMDEAKQEIMEFVSFLKEPGQFQKLGAKIPRGAILSGPPGTGKTLLAKATAGESRVPFFSVSGSEFVEMFVGVGASRVRDLFANARKSTPCIIFIDEIDAIGKSRQKQNFTGGTDEREATLNQILTEMDGFNTSEQVVVLAGTNRPDVLDSALMRPGRFDRHISIDPPTMEGRKQIFKVHLRKIVTDEDMEHLTGRLSALTPGFSGADIANCANEAALIGKLPVAEMVDTADI